MKRKLGFFTSYEIEYVFDFLGESRIKQKIAELKDNPTMGITLNEFTYKDPETSYFYGKGILSLFVILTKWFNDAEFIFFLYEKSKKYNESNYHESHVLKKNWKEYQDSMELMIKTNPENKDTWKSNQINPYWLEYHFFFTTISQKLKEANKQNKILKTDFTGTYSINKNRMRGEIELEIKKRRKPLTGEYLLHRENSIWFNLEPINIGQNLSVYEFTKDKNIYTLQVDTTINKAEIKSNTPTKPVKEPHETTSNKEIYAITNDLSVNYISNFKNISLRIREDTSLMVNGTTIINRVILDIIDFYIENKLKHKADEIITLNNSFSNIWTNIKHI